MATGRTLKKYVYLVIEDSGGTMRNLVMKDCPAIGLTRDEVDVSAITDTIKKKFPGQADFSVTINFPFSDAAAQAAAASGSAPAESGSHTVLSALDGGLTARSFGIYFGMQDNWATDDPVFGGIDTINVMDYTVNGDTCSAKFVYSANAANALAWGTSAITAS